jgi:hypothetical protein
MPAPTDRRRVTLIVLAVLSGGVAALAIGVVDSAAKVATRPLPTADLEAVSAYLAPLPDSSRLAGVGTGTMVVARDPFGSTASAPLAPGGSMGTPPRPAKGRSQQWVVSSILIEASRRSAIVNDAWVSVGDPLGGGARVTAIERKYVVVTDANGTRHTVPIRGSGGGGGGGGSSDD